MTTTLEPVSSTVRKPYPNYKIILLNDDVNTFEHVIYSLVSVLPNMSEKKATAIAWTVHTEGKELVWCGPQEQAELYHLQLSSLGLTLAPLEKE